MLAIIPARGGSKGIPRKNLMPVAGWPLIAWTIDAARHSRLVDRVIVTTDDPEIACEARLAGAETPFLRPAELARDDTPGIDPVLHAVQWLECEEGYRPERLVLLQPTSPLRTAADIDAAAEMMTRRQCAAVVSVTPVHAHPYWMKQVDAQGRMADFLPRENCATRRQDLPEAHALNGALYMIRREVLLAARTLFPADTCAYIMPAERSLDIDTAWDLRLAHMILSELQESCEYAVR